MLDLYVGFDFSGGSRFDCKFKLAGSGIKGAFYFKLPFDPIVLTTQIKLTSYFVQCHFGKHSLFKIGVSSSANNDCKKATENEVDH